MAGNQKIVALSILLAAGAALAAAFFIPNPAAIQNFSTEEPSRANGEDNDKSSRSGSPVTGEQQPLQQEGSNSQQTLEQGPNNEKTSSNDQDGIVADNQKSATMKMDEVFRSAGEEYSGNPPAFNARFENTRADGEVTFSFLMGPDENGYYTMMFFEYNAPCAFSGSHYDALAKLRTGDKVFISGNPYMFGPGVVMLGDCKIIRM